ncbi:hypothetical protein BMI91_08355 [Thioclava sediminum]|uniref:OmpA-like domain-containing protein n=1 Tax=Thioclava sediminum TaxID=1915319 RepID=A0ABX3MWL2_9RHOB|nr:OmpA family protein [Thioclava sediminum]OOY24075.1 hypothetical protein BMI91_08355 [Thioclava sediminum]
MKTLKTTTALVAGLAALSPAILPFSALAQDSNTAAAECIAKAVADGTPMEKAKADCEADAANADGSAEAAAGTDPANADAPMSDSEADQAAKAAIEGAAPPADQDPAASGDTPDASAKAAVEGGADVTTQSETTGTDTNADAAAAATTDANTDANADASAETDAAAATDAQPDAAAPEETDGSATANTDGSTTATADGSTDATTPADGQTDAEATSTLSPDTTSQDAPAPVTDTTENAMQNSEAQADSTATAEPEAKPAGEASTDTTSDTQVVQEGNGGSGAEVEPKVIQPEEAANADATADGSASADTTANAETDQQASQDTAATKATKLLENALTDTKAAIEGEAVQNEALNAPTDSADSADATEETVTEETARSASEDFSTSVDAKRDAEAQATAQTDSSKKKKKDRLSTLETAALSGLGALAVGAILNNGSKVAVNSGDRVVVQQPDGSYQLVKDDNALLRQPGSKIRTQDYADGSSRTIVTKPDGSQIVTVYDAQRQILKRTLVQPDGTQYLLVDDARGADPVDVSALPKPKPVATVSSSNEQALRDALTRQSGIDRTFTLSQVRNITPVRDLAPAISVENINFETGSAAIQPDQAQALSALGQAIQQRIDENPRELFLVEGHTDAVGSAAYNLALSDRRAESVALALSEYFDVPAENLVVQGYGEQDLKVQTEGASEANRRAAVRRITDLLRTASN